MLRGDCMPSAATCSSMAISPFAIFVGMGSALRGELIVKVIGAEVVCAPSLSAATAVIVCRPRPKVGLTWKGEVPSEPREVAPSKNSTLVTLPSESFAVAVINTFVVGAPVKDELFAGELMETVGEALPTITVPNINVKCGSQ